MINYDNRLGMKLLLRPRGSVIRGIMPTMIGFALLALAVVLIDHFIMKFKVTPTPWAIVGSALGFLLVFRTNTAYGRYWEGRKIFGGVSSSIRNLALSSLSYFLREDREAERLKEKLIYLLIAYPKMVKQALRDERDLTEINDTLSHLTDEEVKLLHSAPNVPLTILLLAKKIVHYCVQNKIVPELMLLNLEDEVDRLVTAYGGCDRIRKTPIPFAYVYHLKSLILVFCATLPFALVESMGWMVILATTFVSFAFVGIEEIGVEIEDPFGDDPNDLPLDDICDGVEKIVLDLYHQDAALKQYQSRASA